MAVSLRSLYLHISRQPNGVIKVPNSKKVPSYLADKLSARGQDEAVRIALLELARHELVSWNKQTVTIVRTIDPQELDDAAITAPSTAPPPPPPLDRPASPPPTAEAGGAISDSAALIDKLTRANAALTAQLRQAQEDNRRLLKERQARPDAATTAAALETQARQIAELGAQLESAAAETMNALAERDEHLAKIHDLEFQLSQTNGQLEQADARAAAHTTQIHNLENEILRTSRRTANQRLQNSITKLQEEKAALQGAIDKQKARITELLEEWNYAQRNNADLESARDDALTEIESLTTALDQITGARETMRWRLTCGHIAFLQTEEKHEPGAQYADAGVCCVLEIHERRPRPAARPTPTSPVSPEGTRRERRGQNPSARNRRGRK